MENFLANKAPEAHSSGHESSCKSMGDCELSTGHFKKRRLSSVTPE